MKQSKEDYEMLTQLKREAEDQEGLSSLAVELYKCSKQKGTNPIARFRGTLEFAPGLDIQVCTYKAVRKQKPKALIRYDASVPFDPVVPKQKEVIVEYNYVIKGDESGQIVDKENIINAYLYGPQLVPISPILEAGSKVFEDRNFRMLGFVDKSKVPRHALMGDVEIVVPSKDNALGQKLFTAFIYSMISLNKYGLARYVPRNAKNGVSPKMVVLIPHRSEGREMFYLTELPTVQDVRQYPFNPLKQSNDEQRQLVRNLIGKMMLFDDQGREEVRVEDTYNPFSQYFHQSVMHRAANNSEDLPPVDPQILKDITPEVQKFQKTKVVMSRIKKSFKLIRKKVLVDKSSKAKTKCWKDAISQFSTKEDLGSVKEEDFDGEFELLKPDRRFLFGEEEEDHRVEEEQAVIKPPEPKPIIEEEEELMDLD